MNKRENSLDVIRIIAIVMVFYNHKDSYMWYMNYADSFGVKYVVLSTMAVICKAGAPLFLMVSGVLLLEKQESIKDVFKHRVLRMLIVLVWIATSMYFFKMVDSWKEALLFQANWYIYAYIGYLLMLPLLRKMIKNIDCQTENYYLAMVVIFYSLYCITTPFGVQQSFTRYIPIITAPNFASFSWNIIFPVSGYVLYRKAKERDKNNREIPFVILGIIGSLLASSIIMYAEIKLNGAVNIENIIQYSIIIPTWGIFYLLVKRAGRIKNNKLSNIVSCLSKNTFGMYIIEISTPISPIYVNEFVLSNRFLAGRFWYCIVAILIEFVLYNVVVFVMRRIPLINKVL